MNYQLLQIRRPWRLVFLPLLSLLLGQSTALQAHVPSLRSSAHLAPAQARYQLPISRSGFQHTETDYRAAVGVYTHGTVGADQGIVLTTNAVSGSNREIKNSGGAGEGVD
ncbi:hypothetical protein [Hymenobacter sp. GOD-10R]|uniref:hypothetical protein n=1 Tax=Hymenobacter sp. GOD-10R TaxID=3093922 RepID=UPI002D78BA2D|nr:hypothetical protein [Hymenobacter sp. GOD-10R]WRQ28521.1 hypothetical protein SD425_25985 [Hymenobacter sp. GOD-10R]